MYWGIYDIYYTQLCPISVNKIYQLFNQNICILDSVFCINTKETGKPIDFPVFFVIVTQCRITESQSLSFMLSYFPCICPTALPQLGSVHIYLHLYRCFTATRIYPYLSVSVLLLYCCSDLSVKSASNSSLPIFSFSISSTAHFSSTSLCSIRIAFALL